MKNLVPEHIKNSKLYPPGWPIEEVKRKYGIEKIVKLNSNENCLGPSPMAVKAVAGAAADINLYPDNSAYYLKNRLAEQHGVSPEHIILGNGSNELVQFIIMTFLQPGEEILTAKPTFLLYGIMGRVMGGRVEEIPLKDYSFDLERMAEKISSKTKIIFISNPNNPTGTIVDRDLLEMFIESIPEDVILVLDEAYSEYVTSSNYPDSMESARHGRNIIILKTFSKAFGLAGVRIGYAAAPPDLVSYMERIREPFNASVIAQRAALAALDDKGHLQRTIKNNCDGIDYMYAQLQRMNLFHVPTQANFIFIRLGPKAETICEDLMKEGVLVRSLSDFDMPDYIRVTIGLPEENRRFVEILDKTIAGL